MKKSIIRYFPFFIIPILIFFIISFLIPFILGTYLSFCNFTTVGNAEFNGLNNYINAFKIDSSFIKSFWFTIKVTIVSVITINVISFLLAMLLSKTIKINKFFRTIFFMPNLIGGIILGYIWNLIINGVLGFFDVDITYSASYGFWGLVILMNWQLIGYYMIIYIASIQAVPKQLIESAKIDGASDINVLRHIYLPSVKPTITVCIFLTLVNSFKIFDQNLALTNGAPGNETQMLALDIFNTFYGRTGFNGVGQAKAVMFFIVVGGIALVQLYLSNKNERA